MNENINVGDGGTAKRSSLDAALDDGTRQHEPTPLRAILANNEVERAFNDLPRLIEQQRRRILDAEIDYMRRHAALLSQMSDLDAEYERRLPALQAQLAKLLELRA